MKTNMILATTWVSSNSGKLRIAVVGTLTVLALIAGFGPAQHIAQAGPATGGSH